MRIIVAALAVVACWGLTGAQEKKDDAKKADKPYTNELGKFSIQLPAGAKDPTTKSGNTRDGTVMTALVADCGQGRTCVVIYIDLPDVNKAPEAFFKAAEKAAKDKGDEVKETREFVGQDDTPGYEFTVVCKDGRMLKTRMLIYKTRAYTIVFGADAKTFPAEEAKKVLESFAFLK